MNKNYPINIVFDKTAQDIEEYISNVSKERGITSDIMELILYKVLSNVQREKVYAYTNSVISVINDAAEKAPSEETNNEQGV